MSDGMHRDGRRKGDKLMTHYKMLDGNTAAVEAMKMARVKLISAYPITPQSTIAEKLSEIVESGELAAAYIRVESEHTAMSCAIGAQLTGIRTATATASVGLALMHEVLNVASGCRVPIVMPVVNRSLASPWSLWCDHQDSMAERDSGWIQLYCENVQDVYDTVLMSYRIAEHPEVLTPVMVCLDGFFLSHSMQKLEILKQEQVDQFVGEYCVNNLKLDPADPMVIDNLTGSDEITEMKYQQAAGFERSRSVMNEVFEEYAIMTGRKKAVVEGYRTEGADAVVVTLGSMSGTAKYVVDQMREQGKKVGAVKIVSFRPFPYNELKEMLKGVGRVAVIDRTTGFGGQGAPLWLEVKTALGSNVIINDYIAGLAGRDIHTGTIQAVFENLMNSREEAEKPVWIDCDIENAMNIREVERYV